MIATIGFAGRGNTGYGSIFDDDDATSAGYTATYYFPDWNSVDLVDLYPTGHGHQELLNIENAARSIEAIALIARYYTCKIINKITGIRVFSIIKMMFSRSGYLPWRIRNKRKSK